MVRQITGLWQRWACAGHCSLRGQESKEEEQGSHSAPPGLILRDLKMPHLLKFARLPVAPTWGCGPLGDTHPNRGKILFLRLLTGC